MHRRLGSLSGRSSINNLTTPDPPAGRPAGRAWDEDDDDDEEALYQRASDGESDDDASFERALHWLPLHPKEIQLAVRQWQAAIGGSPISSPSLLASWPWAATRETRSPTSPLPGSPR